MFLFLFPLLSFPLSLSLKINENISSGEEKEGKEGRKKKRGALLHAKESKDHY